VIKTEFLHRTTFNTRADVNLALFAYIDGWYNPKRIQKRLDWLGPDEYEERVHAEQATANQAIIRSRQPALTS
jgi:transposase InsO family protein